ncbi:MAG: nucleotide sugar dehydrogenase [Bdellovibrionota bacterium]
MSLNVGIVGLSHLGLITGVGLASRGANILGFETDASLVAKLARFELPVFEENLSELLHEAGSRVRFTANQADLGGCEVLYIARDVPTSDKNISDPTPILELFEKILPSLKTGATLVIHSQVSPGFTRALGALVERENRNIQLYYQVETLVFGIAMSRMLNPERYIVGCKDPKAPLPDAYQKVLSLFDCPVLPMRYESAELAKISINMFLVSSVITTSTLAELCEEIGAEWGEIAPSLRLDKRIGPHAYLQPGLGIAGGNLERDLVTVQSLAREHGTDSSVIEAWFSNAVYRRDWVLRKLSSVVFSKQDDPLIGIWGIAYKPDTHSIKNSPSVALIDSLKAQRVRAYDPMVKLGERAANRVVQAESALHACEGADVLVLITPWSEFKKIPAGEVANAMKGRVVLDPFGALSSRDFDQAGFTVHTLGKKTEK